VVTRFDIETGEGIQELVALFKSMPERLDKDMRASFRRLAVPIRDDARAKAMAMRPEGKRPKRKGTYTWKKLVNSIQSSADSDTPTLNFGAARVPGWAGWEFGSDKLPQFPRRNKEGRFFFPTVMDAVPDINLAAQKVVDDYIDLYAKL
jgi:hypothetical protein